MLPLVCPSMPAKWKWGQQSFSRGHLQGLSQEKYKTDAGQAAVLCSAQNATHSGGECGSLHRVQKGSDRMSSELMEDSLIKRELSTDMAVGSPLQ